LLQESGMGGICKVCTFLRDWTVTLCLKEYRRSYSILLLTGQIFGNSLYTSTRTYNTSRQKSPGLQATDVWVSNTYIVCCAMHYRHWMFLVLTNVYEHCVVFYFNLVYFPLLISHVRYFIFNLNCENFELLLHFISILLRSEHWNVCCCADSELGVVSTLRNRTLGVTCVVELSV
jgi:hypothetical protein